MKSRSCLTAVLLVLGLAAATALLYRAAVPAAVTAGIRIRPLRPLDTPLPPPSDRPADAPLRVATYNIEHFTDAIGDGPERTPEAFAAQAAGAAAIVAAANPDILLVEEIENERALLALNDALPTPYPHACVTVFRTRDGTRDTLNHAVLSRVPILEARELSFTRYPKPGTPARGSLAVRVALSPAHQLLLYSLHLKSNFGETPRNRAQRGIALHVLAADALNQRLALATPPPEAPDAPPVALSVLLLGDTNVDPGIPEFADDPSLAPLAGEYVDLIAAMPPPDRPVTLPTRLPGNPDFVFRPAAFDRVFASRDLAGETSGWRASPPSVVADGCATGDNTLAPGIGGHVSDHYLVYLDLSPASAPAP
ncbi:MAG: endonuclease/exonuclease/phosphatase family protein [Kiritimatiellae bacterium]|nr:endonuclease/exonuclease/phosphatase family protein [Kiritimatiellia bacterium]